jgi:hypothetical protein
MNGPTAVHEVRPEITTTIKTPPRVLRDTHRAPTHGPHRLRFGDADGVGDKEEFLVHHSRLEQIQTRIQKQF